MELKFRFATRDDVKELVEVCNACFDENTPHEKALGIFDRTYHDPNQLYLIGVLDGRIVAHTKITIVPTLFDGMDTFAILNHVCVKPELRRGHIGTRMLDECFKIAKENNCKCVELWSKNFRVAAHGLYNRYGFEVVDAKFFAKNVE